MLEFLETILSTIKALMQWVTFERLLILSLISFVLGVGSYFLEKRKNK